MQPLSSQNLRASSSTDTDSRHLLYRVVRGPQLGRLFHAQQGSAEEALVNFTQAEVRAKTQTPDLPQVAARQSTHIPGI